MFIDFAALGKIVVSVLGFCALVYIAVVGSKQNTKQHTKGAKGEQAAVTKSEVKTETKTQTAAQTTQK